MESLGAESSEKAEEIEIPSSAEATEGSIEKSAVIEKLYESKEGAPIELTYRTFERADDSDEKREREGRSEIVLLPGVGLDVGTKTAENMATPFAASARGGKTYAIRSKVRELVEDAFDQETEAIVKFIEDEGLENFILVGQSQGGKRAAQIAALLGDKVRAVEIISGMGLYEQENLTKNFLKDSTVNTPIAMLTDLVKMKSGSINNAATGIQTGNDVMLGMLTDIARIYRDEPQLAERIKEEVQGITHVEPYLKDIKSPVFVITGAEDPISNPEKIAPLEHKQYARDVYTDLGRELYGYDEEHDARVNNAHARDQYLKDNVFTSSPYVKMIIAEKSGQHGVGMTRAEQMADVGLGLVEKAEREIALETAKSELKGEK